MAKRFLCLVLMLMIIFTLCACGGKDVPVETMPPEETVIIPPASYDKEDGRLYREVYYNANGFKYQSIIYEYDGFGRLAKQIELGENDAPVSYSAFEYNEDGLKTAMLYYAATGPEEYEFSYRTDYEYDENGNCTREQRTENDIVASVTVYSYDENGALLKEDRYEGEEFLLCTYEYEYDENGNAIKCIRHDYMEGIDLEDRYSYNSDNQVIGVVSCDAEGNTTSRIEYVYDEEGSEIKCSVYNAQGELDSSTQNEYSYDEAGNIEKIIRTHSDGTQGTTIQYTWQYSKG